MDQASLARMPDLPTADVVHHADLVIRERLKPHELYQRWEAQQWNAEAVDLDRDRDHFRRLLPADAKAMISESIATFIIGEYTGLDLLGPIMVGAPDERDHLYLGTQVADEA